MVDFIDRVRSALSDRYTVERELGHGGMATVFLAEDTKHSRQVAIKVIRPEIAISVGVGRFLREIGIAARLTHPHIVPVYDSGDVDDVMYYVMPFVEGESLREKLEREQQIEIAEAIGIASEVASALSYAHTHHVVHRDIKPGNILLANGHAVVMDFGVARAIGDVGRESITAPGIAVGTPTYMSPEQASGEGQLDGRSDIYSLGCVLYEMLVGEPPYPGATTHAVIAKCFSEPVPSVRRTRYGVPTHVDHAIAKALAKVASARYDTAIQFAEALSVPGAAAPRPQPKSIAVLPFVNMSPEPENAYFSDGITEEITNALAKLRGLRVAARTSAFAYKGKSLATTDIGRELNVDTVLEGSVRKMGNRLRVTAQLTDVIEGYQLWSERFDREMEDVFAIQDEIASAIVGTLKGRWAAEQHEQIVKRYTENVEAYELYLKGRYVEKSRRREGFDKGIDYFEQAIAKDPNYALAYAGLADSYTFLAFYRFLPPHDAFPKANVAAMRALEADELLPEAHTSQAEVRFLYDWDWNGAEREFARALELHPEDATASHLYSEYLVSQQRLVEAIEHVNRAQHLEPLSPTINTGVGWTLYFGRDFESAIDQLLKTRDLDPEYVFVHWFLGLAYLAAGRNDDAIETYRQGLELSGEHAAMTAYLAYALAKSGKSKDARRLLRVLKKRSAEGYVPSDYFAVVHLGLGEIDETFTWLERACRERAVHLVFLNADPLFDGIRLDSRFTAILQSLGLKRE
ncbi:MAG: protein kinase [Gemmatimonadales bacterium]|jgi:serine/threonine-protein kinase